VDRWQNRDMEKPGTAASNLCFQAAVERPLSVVFRTSNDLWEGHDYLVEVVTERRGLDVYDVVMDFRDLETELEKRLTPLQGRLLSDLGLEGPLGLARKLAAELAPAIPSPVRLVELALTDGRGRRVAVKP
jgi:hypothetical protein